MENFAEIALSHTVKEIEANLCLPFLAKIRKFKMAAIFGEGKIFGKLQRVHSLDTLRVKNSVALSLTVSEILRFFGFSQKFKMAAKSGEN